MQPVRLVTTAVLLLATLSPATADAETGDHDEQAHHVVRITDGTLNPGLVTMHANEAIAWANFSAKYARISFDRDVAKRITCEAPGGFQLTETALESNEVHPRQFVSLCRLQPGEYSYRVLLRGTTRGFIDATGMAGRIAVTE